MTDRIRLPLALSFAAAFVVTFALLAAAHADTGDGGALDAADDVFSAGRRSGLLWLAIGLGVTVGLRAISVRLKPRADGTGPKPGSRRAKLSIIVGGLAMVLAAAIDMFATSRGMTPIMTAAGLAMAAYFGAADDPPRGSKRTEAAGEIDDGGAPT